MIAEDLTNDLQLLNVDQTSNENRMEIRHNFWSILGFYSDAKQLGVASTTQNLLYNFTHFHRFMIELCAIFKHLMTVVMCWALCSMCSTLLRFKIQLVEYNFNHFFKSSHKNLIRFSSPIYAQSSRIRT